MTLPLHDAECCECGKASLGPSWHPEEVCLFGMLFACSLKCAEDYARKHAREGYHPGEPHFDAVAVVNAPSTEEP